MALLRLFDPTTQFQTKSGALNVAGKLRIYVESTDDLANIYGDDGSLLSQPLLLDSNGRARGLFVDSGRSYRLEAYDRNDSLLFTIRRLEPNASGTIISQTVFIKGTPDEIDVEDYVTEESRTYTASLSAKVTGKIEENREAIVKESEARKAALEDKVDKVYTATENHIAVFDNAGNIKDSGKTYADMQGEFKRKQTAKSSPTASGNTLSFIDTVSQDAEGVITATKKSVTVDSTYSPSGTNPVNGKAVKAAIDGLDAAITSNDGTNVQVKVTETDGKISAVNITSDNTENKINKVSSWQTTPDDTHYPSEKLVKDGLDEKADANKVVAICDSKLTVYNVGINKWFKIAERTFAGTQNGFLTWWDVEVNTVSIIQTGTLCCSVSYSTSGTELNSYSSFFCDEWMRASFKFVTRGLSGPSMTIELWASLSLTFTGLSIRERSNGNIQPFVGKGYWKYYSYLNTDGSAAPTEDAETHTKVNDVEIIIRQHAIASPTNDNLVAMDANGLVKDSGLAKSSVESAIRKAGSAIQGVMVNGTTLTPDANKIVTVPLATKSADGAMSAADKTKLDGIAAGTASPLMDGEASVGNSLKYAREDHVHPSDTSREDIANKITVVLGTSDSKYPTDKAVAEFVNSSIATNTANYISNNGEPFTSVEQLNAYSGPVTNNDYAFVTGTDSEGNTYYDRYKATVNGSSVTWSLEYRLNNSSFTAAQWSAINSGITSVLVAKIHDHSNKDVLDGITSDKVNSWDGKEDAFDVLPTTKGGTGTNAASKSALTSSLINSLSIELSKPVDADYYVSQYQNGGTSNTSFVRRPVSALWEYIKDKISSVLGLTALAYSGKAATAGTADKAVADKSGNDIETTYATKSELSTHTSDTTVHITAAERTAWNAKQDALTFDTTPTAGSTNPVTSGGIKTALEVLQTNIDTVDAKGIVINEIDGDNVICFE